MYRLAIRDDEPVFPDAHVDAHASLAASILDEAGIAYEITPRAEDLARRLCEQPDCFAMPMLDILLDVEYDTKSHKNSAKVTPPPYTGITLAQNLRATGFSGGILSATATQAFTLESYSVYPVHHLLKPTGLAAFKEAQLPVGRVYDTEALTASIGYTENKWGQFALTPSPPPAADSS